MFKNCKSAFVCFTGCLPCYEALPSSMSKMLCFRNSIWNGSVLVSLKKNGQFVKLNQSDTLASTNALPTVEWGMPKIFKGLVAEMNAVILCDVIAYLLVLVSGDGSEDRLREAEGLDSLPAGHRLVGRQFAAEVFPDDMNTRLILVHGVEDDLKIWKEIRWGSAANMAPVVSSDGAVCECSSQSFRWNHFWRKLNSNPRAEHLLKKWCILHIQYTAVNIRLVCTHVCVCE